MERSEQSPLSPEGVDRFLEQVFAIWVTPEVERRRAAGLIGEAWQLIAAQIVFNLGATNEVRLNDQVKAVLKLRSTRAIAVGERITEDDFSEITGAELTAKDENAGHVSLFLHKGKWYAFFDFRYNARTVRENLAATDEFIASAASNLEAGRLRPALDDLGVATERLAKGYLLLLPDERFLDVRSHGVVLSDFTKYSSLGNAPTEYAKLLKDLRNISADSRYSVGPPRYGKQLIETMLELARSMRRDLAGRTPPEPTV